MSICHQCQRDPDLYDAFIRKQEKRVEVAEKAAFLLGERLKRMRALVTDMADYLSKAVPDSSYWVEDLAPRVDKELDQ